MLQNKKKEQGNIFVKNPEVMSLASAGLGFLGSREMSPNVHISLNTNSSISCQIS